MKIRDKLAITASGRYNLAMKSKDTENWFLARGVKQPPYNLDRIKALLKALGNPQNNFASILVGGTNGKGSVTAMLESIMLQTEIYNIGSFTSPHLLSLKERIKINGNEISDKLLTETAKKIQALFSEPNAEDIKKSAFFESITAAAFLAFEASETDLAILEVGLGGRYDSTNTASPEFSIITNVGTDHKEFLGNTKKEIAIEKLEIVHKKRSLITAEKDPEILALFKDKTDSCSSALINVNEKTYFELIESNQQGHRLKLLNSEIFLHMPGDHQLENLKVALEGINQLRINGFDISDKAIVTGLEKVKWLGRLTKLSDNPPFFIDAAHNIESVQALTTYLTTYWPNKKFNIIFGSLRDKPAENMLSILAPHAAHFYFAVPPTPRALTEEELSKLDTSGIASTFCESVSKAFTKCEQDKSTPVICCGSIYLISEALKLQ